MPFLNFGGVLADDASIETELLEEAGRLLRSIKADYLELRHLKKSSGTLATKTHKVSMMVELPAEPEALFARLDRRRSVPRTAIQHREAAQGVRPPCDRRHEPEPR